MKNKKYFRVAFIAFLLTLFSQASSISASVGTSTLTHLATFVTLFSEASGWGYLYGPYRQQSISVITPTSEGKFALGGSDYYTSMSEYQGLVGEIDASGTPAWMEAFKVGDRNQVSAISPTLDGLFASANIDNDCYISKWTSKGNMSWMKKIDSSSSCQVIKTTNDGNLLISFNYLSSLIVAEVSASTKEIVWSKSLDITDKSYITPVDMALISEEEFALLGTYLDGSSLSSNQGSFISVWNKDGGLVWTGGLEAEGDIDVTFTSIESDGESIFALGEREVSYEDQDLVVVKVTRSGQEGFIRVFDNNETGEPLYTGKIMLKNNGGIVGLGNVGLLGSFIMELDSTGSLDKVQGFDAHVLPYTLSTGTLSGDNHVVLVASAYIVGADDSFELLIGRYGLGGVCTEDINITPSSDTISWITLDGKATSESIAFSNDIITPSISSATYEREAAPCVSGAVGQSTSTTLSIPYSTKLASYSSTLSISKWLFSYLIYAFFM